MLYQRKIIAFDNNYHFSHRFIILLDIFRKNQIDLEFICDDKSFTKKEENIQGLLIKNISNYPSNNFLKILKIEKPDLVIVLNINLLKIRSLNRCCKFLKIPIIFLDHGITSVAGKTGSKRFDSNKFLIKRYKRIITGELIKEYLSYMKYLIYTKTSFKDYLLFLFESISKLIGKDSFTEDWIYSAYCVFLNSDKNKLVSQYKNLIDKNKIYVVGNYDLNLFKLIPKNINSYNINNKSRNILYFDSDCINRTFDGNMQNYVKYILQIRDILKLNDFNLQIKLHPNALNNKVNLELSKLSIENIEQNNLINVLLKSKYVITEPTSIAAIACLTGIPIITPLIAPFNKKRYGEMLDQYPSRVNFGSFKELDNILKYAIIYSDKIKINNWLDNYAGPLPPSEFPHRVLKVVKKFI